MPSVYESVAAGILLESAHADAAYRRALRRLARLEYAQKLTANHAHPALVPGALVRAEASAVAHYGWCCAVAERLGELYERMLVRLPG